MRHGRVFGSVYRSGSGVVWSYVTTFSIQVTETSALRPNRHKEIRDETPSRSGFRPTAISAHNLDLNDFVAADCAFSNRCCVARVDKSKNSLVCSVACAANF